MEQRNERKYIFNTTGIENWMKFNKKDIIIQCLIHFLLNLVRSTWLNSYNMQGFYSLVKMKSKDFSRTFLVNLKT